jgi:hypothetical protein
MTIYGHLNLNCFFKELFALTDDGIIYKGNEYKWKDIQKIERSFGSLPLTLLMYGRRYPGATIYLNNGQKIRLNGRVFTAKGERPNFGAEGFITSESTAFNQVIDIIEKRI